jgi:hypothetical protein
MVKEIIHDFEYGYHHTKLTLKNLKLLNSWRMQTDENENGV